MSQETDPVYQHDKKLIENFLIANAPKKVKFIKITMEGSNKNDTNHFLEVPILTEKNTQLTYSIMKDGEKLRDVPSLNNGDHSILATYTGYKQDEYLHIELEELDKVEAILLYPYRKDGRTYNNCIVSISENGTDWEIVYQGDITGTDEPNVVYSTISKNMIETIRNLPHFSNDTIHVTEHEKEKLEAVKNSNPKGRSMVEKFDREIPLDGYKELYPREWRGINGTYSDNAVEKRTDTYDRLEDFVWIAKNSDSDRGASGGCTSDYHKIDPSKRYRVSVWAKRPDGMSLSDGTIYLGIRCSPNSAVVVEDDGTTTNPYMWYGDLPTNDWHLIVGYINPADATIDTDNLDGGIYRYGSSDKVMDIAHEFRFGDNVTDLRMRFYQFYSTIDGIETHFQEPRIDVCDGTEVSIEELLNAPIAKLSSSTSKRSVGDIWYDNETKTFKGETEDGTVNLG